MKYLLSLFLCVLIGCAPLPALPPATIESHICQIEDCAGILVEFIRAHPQLECAFFDLDIPEVMGALEDANASLVLDGQYASVPNVSVVLDTSKQYMHNKFCVFNDTVLTGSFNPTISGNASDRNNMIVLHSTEIAEQYRAEFLELQKGVFGGGEPSKKVKVPNIEVYFCPEDNCRNHVVQELQKANESIYFLVYSFTDEDIANTLLMSKAKVVGVLDTLQAGGQYSQYKRLIGFGMNVSRDSFTGLLHHKFFVIDKSTVITGSYNPTQSGSEKNDENVVIIRDKATAEKFFEEVERAMQRA